jgi:hypothetical protein
MIAVVVAFLFALALPLATAAAPAFTNLSVDRTAVASGETVTFTIRATPQTNFVFATADGVRTQGTRITGNEWSVTVSPSHTTTVSVFVNNTNNESGAAVMNIPVTVGATAVTTPTVAHTVVIPPAPPNLGPIDIASVTETPAERQGFVQLTVVTGAQATDVWANFDRVNNARATGRFARGTMISQDTNSRTWVVNFDPAVWAAQTVEVGANRSYTWTGAATRSHNLTLTQPFVPTATPRINSVSVSPRSIRQGTSTTFTIATNVDVEHVGIRDADGREFTANRTTTTATTRNWTVTFSAQRAGQVRVFANNTRTETGAATRNENISFGGQTGWGDARIVGTPSATWRNNNRDLRVTVTTNRYAETVWVVLPGETRRTQLQRSNSGTGNRTWTEDIRAWDDLRGNVRFYVSSDSGTLNNLASDDSRSVRIGDNWDDDWGTGSGDIRRVELEDSRFVRAGDPIRIVVRTSRDIDRLEIHCSRGYIQRVHGNNNPRRHVGNNESEWEVEIDIRSDASRGDVTFTVRAYEWGDRVDSRSTPTITIE